MLQKMFDLTKIINIFLSLHFFHYTLIYIRECKMWVSFLWYFKINIHKSNDQRYGKFIFSCFVWWINIQIFVRESHEYISYVYILLFQIFLFYIYYLVYFIFFILNRLSFCYNEVQSMEINNSRCYKEWIKILFKNCACIINIKN